MLSRMISTFLRLLPCGIVDQSVLEQRQEDEGDAEVGPDVDGFRVSDWRKRIVDRRRRCRHRKQRRYRQCDASWSLNIKKPN
jgi:hypothetical protein